MSDFDNLNPTRGTVVSGLAGAVSTYEPYDATITLTFKNRQERAEWIQKNSEQVYQIAVANTINQKRVYNKKCAITSFEFVENPYTNGIQTVLTLKLFGKWQSSLTEIEINSETYSGGTKSYSVDVPIREIDEGASGVAGEPEEDGRVPYTHTAYSWSADGTDPTDYTWSTPRVKKSYAYDSELRYGVAHYVSAIKLGGEHGFLLTTKPRNGGLTVNLKSDYNGHQFALESKRPNLITGLSSNFVSYPYTSFTALDQFTMLDGGTVTSYGWNIENNEMPYLYEMFNNVEKYPISVGAVDQNGALVPIHVYTYTAQDFI